VNPRDILKIIRREPNISILKATGSSIGDHIMSKLRYKKPDNSAAIKALGLTALLGAGKNAVVTKALRSAANPNGVLVQGHEKLPDIINSGLKSMGRLALHEDPYTAYGGMAALGASSGVASALLLKPLINKARQNMSKVSSIAGPISEYYSRSIPEEFVKQAFMGQLMAKMPYSRGANIAKGVALGGAGIGAGALAYRNRIMNNISKFKDDYDDYLNKGNKVMGDDGKLVDASTQRGISLGGIFSPKSNIDYNTARRGNIDATTTIRAEEIAKKEEELKALKNNYSYARKGLNPDGSPMVFSDHVTKAPVRQSIPEDTGITEDINYTDGGFFSSEPSNFSME
jgi:hypothetical protein